MRESNFAFPAQNRACVCISSQLYDRRALDTTSPLPLFNSLSHLTYLTSTSPRIREILTFDGGLERLVRILRDFCQAPPPPESPQLFYGLLPPPPPSSSSSTTTTTGHKRPPAPGDLKSFDRAAAYRFSLAFQCVANIGVRGSEPIRSRVVQAGTLDVVGCVLESWLQSRGFAVLPSSSASGLPRESKEQRLARRQQLAQQQQQQQAAEIARALERARAVQEAAAPFASHAHGHAHPNHTHAHHGAGQVVARRHAHAPHHPLSVSAGPSNSTSASDEEMADVSPAQTRPSSSVSMNSLHSASSGNASGADTSAHATPVGSSTPTGTVVVPATRDRSGTVVAPRPVGPWDHAHAHAHTQAAANRRRARTVTQRNRQQHATDTEDEDVEMAVNDGRAVGIVQGDADDGHGGHLNLLIDGIVALGQNDDLAMGAPPGAPGATTPVAAQVEEEGAEEEDVDMAPTETPRQTVAQLPQPAPAPTPRPSGAGSVHNTPSVGQRLEDGPYREEDVLIALQLLAYLSKYPHVRQAFYKKRVESGLKPEPAEASRSASPVPHRESALGGFARALVGSPSPRGSAAPPASPSAQHQPIAGPSRISTSMSTAAASPLTAAPTPVIPNAAPLYPRPAMTQSPNIFSLVERFTFRPSANEAALPAPPDFLPQEIQYWAGVIMRNACRKDDSRGGIRQCANMLCGKWEESPRQFAKCRRCRKAKYCGKECQSRAWAEGHRFWCSAREEEGAAGAAGQGALVQEVGATPTQPAQPTGRQTRSVARATAGTVAPAPSPQHAQPATAAPARGGVNSFPGPVAAPAPGVRRRAGTLPTAPPAPPTSPNTDPDPNPNPNPDEDEDADVDADADADVDADDMVIG